MKELDNIIFDVKPHEVDEALELLEAWGYDLDFDFANINDLSANSVRVKDGKISVSYLYICQFDIRIWFRATLEELRTVTAELKA